MFIKPTYSFNKSKQTIDGLLCDVSSVINSSSSEFAFIVRHNDLIIFLEYCSGDGSVPITLYKDDISKSPYIVLQALSLEACAEKDSEIEL